MKIIDEKSDRYVAAKQQVEEEKKFYIHLGTYIIMNIFFVILNLVTSPNHLWFYWPMLGWGLGLAFNALKVFGSNAIFSKEWEEKKIDKYMRKDREKR
jgi:hypothetical protein